MHIPGTSQPITVWARHPRTPPGSYMGPMVPIAQLSQAFSWAKTTLHTHSKQLKPKRYHMEVSRGG